MPSSASTSNDPADRERAAEESPPRASSTWRTTLWLIRFAAHVSPTAFGLTVATALGASLAEGVGLVLLLPLLAVAGVNFTASDTASRLGAEAQWLLARAGVPHWLWLPVVLGLFLAMGALRGVLRRSQSMLVATTVTEVELALSRRVYQSVVKAQWGYLVRQRAGRLTHLLTDQLRRVADAVILSLSLINVCGLTLLYLALALKLSATMTALVLAMGGALLFLQRHSLAQVQASGKDVLESAGEVYAATEEHLLNLKSVKTYNAEDRDVEMFARLCDDVARNMVGNARHQAASAFRFEVGSLAALGAIIFLALDVLHVQPATMLLLLAIFTRLMPQLAALQSQTHEIASVLPAFEHVLQIEAECRAHADSQEAEPRVEAATPLRLDHELRLEEAWYAYNAIRGRSAASELEFVLRGLTLPIEAGTLTAVVGPSGSGKSTIADLTNGLLQPTRGRLLLDGRELGAAEMRQWRSQVGYVGQDTVLFHQSVRENLEWAQPHVTEDEMRAALELAQAEFVYELPAGLETVVGDRGILLSGGQRQRISLARALLRRPTLLILDEATNALDVENEARVLDAIRAAIRERKLTVLMMAHRVSAIRRADRIFELADGRIARSGTWDELSGETRAPGA